MSTVNPYADREGTKLPPEFGRRPAWQFVRYEVALFREESLPEARQTAREIAARCLRPVWVERVDERTDNGKRESRRVRVEEVQP